MTIAAGATVTLNGVNFTHGQIICAGDATIILADGSVNTVNATNVGAAIKIGPKNTTLTIDGTGQLTATGGNYGAGIGTSLTSNYNNTCGAIIINGGTLNAIGGSNAAGIGTGAVQKSLYQTCSAITIATNGPIVTATKGENAPYSIGKGGNYGGNFNVGTIAIGGTTYPDGVSESPFNYPPSN